MFLITNTHQVDRHRPIRFAQIWIIDEPTDDNHYVSLQTHYMTTIVIVRPIHQSSSVISCDMLSLSASRLASVLLTTLTRFSLTSSTDVFCYSSCWCDSVLKVFFSNRSPILFVRIFIMFIRYSRPTTCLATGIRCCSFTYITKSTQL